MGYLLVQIVPEQLVDSLFKACHSDSYERLQYAVKVRFVTTFTYTQNTNSRETRTLLHIEYSNVVFYMKMDTQEVLTFYGLCFHM